MKSRPRFALIDGNLLRNRFSGSVFNRLLLIVGAISIVAAAFLWMSGSSPLDSGSEEDKAAAILAEKRAAEKEAEAARLAEERLQERIAELEEGIREKVFDHLRGDAELVGFALRDMGELIDEYERGVDPFVENLHSLGGKGRLLYALGRDFSGMPGKMIRSSGSLWEERSEESLWRTLRSGEILEIVAEAVRNGYGLPLVEALVEEMWHDAFDGRIDVAQLVTDRFERLASELEARRNLLAVEIEESFLELIGLRGFHPVVVDDWLIEQLEAGITQKAGKLGAQSVGIELLAFGGGELAAYQILQISRKLANRAAGQLGRRMAGSVLARTGGTVASAVGSSWMTFGLSLAVAVVVDIGFNEISEYRMKKELRENMQEFREMFWEGTDEMPGIYPQMIAAFFDYQSRMVGVFEKSSSEWNGFAGLQLVSENQFRQQELEFVKEKGGL